MINKFLTFFKRRHERATDKAWQALVQTEEWQALTQTKEWKTLEGLGEFEEEEIEEKHHD